MKPKICQFCEETNSAESQECSKCFNPLTLEAAIEKRNQHEQVLTQAKASDLVVYELLGEIRKLKNAQEKHEELLKQLISREKAVEILARAGAK